MKRVLIILALCEVSATAQPKFNAPLIGLARDSQKQVRVMHGVAGSFIWHEAIDGTAHDWAFASQGGLVKTDKELLVIGASGSILRRHSVQPGGVVLSPEAAFSPATGELWLIGAATDRTVQIEPEAIAGTVMALGRANLHSAQLAVCRASQLWLLTVEMKTGSIPREVAVGGEIGEQACRPGRASSLLLMREGLLLATAEALLTQTATGQERRVPISTNRAARPEIRRAGEQWIEVESAGSPALMVRITVESEKIYQLPVAKVRQ
jgi:hypothetical protein